MTGVNVDRPNLIGRQSALRGSINRYRPIVAAQNALVRRGFGGQSAEDASKGPAIWVEEQSPTV